MKLSNSIKLSMANFSLFWKILIYKLIAVGISIALVLPVLSVINNCLTICGFYESVESWLTFSAFQSVSAVLENAFIMFNILINSAVLLFQTNTFIFVYLAVLVLFVIPFILKLSDLPTSEATYSYMSSLNKNSFVVNFTDDFGKSAGYSALKTLIEIPYWVALLAGVYGLLSISDYSLGINILSPLLIFVFITLMVSLKTTILSGWASSVVVFNLCAGKALKKGIKAVARKFNSTLSSFAVVSVVMFAVIYIFGIYSAIVVVPLSSLIITVFGQVLFFESQGMNYYITPDNIVLPRKLEQADSIKKVKNII